MPQNYIGSLIYQYKLQPWQPIKDGVDIMSMQTNFRLELFEIVFNNGTTALIKTCRSNIHIIHMIHLMAIVQIKKCLSIQFILF